MRTYWLMGILAALLLFVSVLLHELSHSLVARARRIKVETITLFFFGGVAGITREDLSPKSEFLMAIAGPLFSLVFSGVLYLIHANNGNSIVQGITFYLYNLNFVLALFNLVPGFPLDGGRAFRAILYGYYHDLKKATRIAVTVGRFFAGFLVILGILGILQGVGNGWWFIILGGFLYFIGGVSYEQVVVREALHKVPLREVLSKNIPVISSAMTLGNFIKKYSKSQDDVFIVRGKKTDGILDIALLQKMPLEKTLPMKDLMVGLDAVKGLSLPDDAYMALQRCNELGITAVPVVEQGRIIGVVRRDAVMRRLLWELSLSPLK